MVLDTILILLASIYGGRVAYFFRGFQKERNRWQEPQVRPSVSVVVPARNEESNLESCITSIALSTYPRELLEVIVVNDRSTDSTATIANDLAKQWDFVKVVHRTEDSVEQNLQGKAGALQAGMDIAQGEILLLTDGDCMVSNTWIDGMTAQFKDSAVGIVSGLTSVSGAGFFDRLQDVEWLYTQCMAAGGVGNGTRLGCFGNNMAIRRSVFEELGGYRNIQFSLTEDMALQNAAFEAGHKLRFAISPLVSVTTQPCSTFPEYVKQRHRWVRGGTGLGIRAVVFVATSMTLWAGLAISLASSSWKTFWLFVALRLLADSILIGVSARAIGRIRMIPMLIPAMCILVLTELFIPFLVTRKTVIWKGQSFRS